MNQARVNGRRRNAYNVCKVGLFSFLGWLAVGALCRTLRFRVHDPDGWVGRARRHHGKIWVCWHGQQLVAFYFFRRRGTGILSSQHRDGDYSSSILRRFGWHIVRGSSTRGGARGLLELVRYLRDGWEVGLTPDGPQGPPYQVEPGALYLAAKVGVPIVPFAVAARPSWNAPSWDRFLVPLPFARCAVFFGEAFWVRKEEVKDAGLPALQGALAEAIHRANRGAEAMLFGWD